MDREHHSGRVGDKNKDRFFAVTSQTQVTRYTITTISGNRGGTATVGANGTSVSYTVLNGSMEKRF